MDTNFLFKVKSLIQKCREKGKFALAIKIRDKYLNGETRLSKKN